MHIFDYTSRGRSPTAQQIVSDWKRAGRPVMFQVEYGKTFAQFESINAHAFVGGHQMHWYDSGNGGTGVKRNAVVLLLNKEAQEGAMS